MGLSKASSVPGRIQTAVASPIGSSTDLNPTVPRPTDLEAVSARKREAKAQAQTEITILLVWLIICLGMLRLLFKVLGQ
jgi:hypothetical protein